MKLLWHPTMSPAVVHSSNHVANEVHDFHGQLGIEFERQPLESGRWMDVAAEARDKALEHAVPAANAIAVGGVVLLKVLQNRERKG